MLFVLTFISALVNIAGSIILFSSKAKRFDVNKKRTRFLSGLRIVVFSALAGFVFTLCSVVTDVIFNYEVITCFIAQCLMCLGCAICAFCGFPLMKKYKSTES